MNDVTLTTYEELIAQIGEPVAIFHDPRNEAEHAWTVGLERVPMIHEHFPSLGDGLRWLLENKPRFPEWEEQIRAASLLTRSQASDILGVHPNTVMSWAERGWLDQEWDNGQSLYTADSVHDLKRRMVNETAARSDA